MREYVVYKHTNLINGKVYIGITSQKPESRWKKGGGYKNNKHFYRAIKEYGWGNFSHDILTENLSIEEAETLEKLLIKKYDSCNPQKIIV